MTWRQDGNPISNKTWLQSTYVLFLKSCIHHYLSITKVHSEGTPTAFDLQPHIHSHVIASCAELQCRSIWTHKYVFSTTNLKPAWCLKVIRDSRLHWHLTVSSTRHSMWHQRSKVFLPLPPSLFHAYPHWNRAICVTLMTKVVIYVCITQGECRGPGSVKDLIQSTAVAFLI